MIYMYMIKHNSKYNNMKNTEKNIRFILFLVKGDYTIQTTVQQPSTGVQYGCFEFDATLKRKETHGQGWLLGRRRRRSD